MKWRNLATLMNICKFEINRIQYIKVPLRLVEITSALSLHTGHRWTVSFHEESSYSILTHFSYLASYRRVSIEPGFLVFSSTDKVFYTIRGTTTEFRKVNLDSLRLINFYFGFYSYICNRLVSLWSIYV